MGDKVCFSSRLKDDGLRLQTLSEFCQSSEKQKVNNREETPTKDSNEKKSNHPLGPLRHGTALKHPPRVNGSNGETEGQKVHVAALERNLSKAEKDLAWIGEQSVIDHDTSNAFNWEYIHANAPPELKILIQEKNQNSSLGECKIHYVVRSQAREAFRYERRKAREILKRKHQDGSRGAGENKFESAKTETDRAGWQSVKPDQDKNMPEKINRHEIGAIPDESKNDQLHTGSAEEGSENKIILPSQNEEVRNCHLKKASLKGAFEGLKLLESEVELAWLGEESILARCRGNIPSSANCYFDWDYILRHASGPLQKCIQEKDNTVRKWRQNCNRLNYFIRNEIKNEFSFLRKQIRNELSTGYRRARTRRFLPSPLISNVPKPLSAQTAPDQVSSFSPSINTTKKRKWSPLVTLARKKIHSVGDRVYARRHPNSMWCPGVVQGFRVMNCVGAHEAVRQYDIVFENGNRDPALDEIFVMAKEDWSILCQKQLKTQCSSLQQMGSNVREGYESAGRIGFPRCSSNLSNADDDVFPSSRMASGTDESNKVAFNGNFSALRIENARLHTVAKRREEGVHTLKEMLDISEQRVYKHKELLHSTKKSLEATEQEVLACKQREQSLKIEVVEWIEKLASAEAKLKEERRSRKIALESVERALEESKRALLQG